jgi:hypothetical protein
MGPVRKTDGASGSNGMETTKPYVRQKPQQDERSRKRLRVERDSDDDVQILEDDEIGLPSGRTSQKFAGRESTTHKEPETSGKSGRSSKNNTESKGKGKSLGFKLLGFT